MFSVFGLIIILIIKSKTRAEEDLDYNNGWKPLSSEMVLKNLHRNNNKPSELLHSPKIHWNPALLVKENIRRIDTTNIKPHDINRELMSYDDYSGIDQKPNLVSLTGTVNKTEITFQLMLEKKQNQISEYLFSGESRMMLVPVAEHQRQAKHIYDNQENANIIYNFVNKNDSTKTKIPETVKIEETNNINSQSNIYEVTEVSEGSEIKDLLDVDEIRTDEVKSYFVPNVKATTEKNLTNILVNILDNYNIRINDDLTNYATSINKHNSYNNKHSYIYPGSIKIQPMRNSQNHFPLDPILAVLLSNYGFYLPGFYGFPGNYYNIYGYLASNNIHNNMPFGAYKIYSDTDSSH